MPVNCSVCGLICASDSDSIKCIGNCQGVFHTNCVSGVRGTRGGKSEWQCEVCKPTKGSSLSSSKSASATPITKELLVRTLEAFKGEVFEELRKNGKEFAEFRASLDYFSEKIDKSNELMEQLQQSHKKLQRENQDLKEENKALKKSVAVVEQRVRNLEQYSRQTNIEISGVPETNGEKMEELLGDVARAVGMELKKERVVAAHRVPSYNRNRTPPIIVKFASRRDRDEWLDAFKKMRPLTADKINHHFKKDKVFINEHLSPENKQLLGRTKEMARDRGYKYVWTREGKIFVRREDNERCIKVEGVEDLDKL